MTGCEDERAWMSSDALALVVLGNGVVIGIAT